MSDIIDFNERRSAAERPDAEFMHKDEFGRPMFTFLLNYEMDGHEWGLHLVAYDQADAQKRVEAMRASLEYCGQLYEVRPA